MSYNSCIKHIFAVASLHFTSYGTMIRSPSHNNGVEAEIESSIYKWNASKLAPVVEMNQSDIR